MRGARRQRRDHARLRASTRSASSSSRGRASRPAISIRSTTRAASSATAGSTRGDLGRFDADGYLWLTGRAKDVIIRGGHNIDPAVIEETLLKHPDVLLAAAVGKPDAYAGELPVAYVQLVADAQGDRRRTDRFRARPHSRSAPRHRRRSSSSTRMPLTDVGKPVKAQLRATRRSAPSRRARRSGGRRGRDGGRSAQGHTRGNPSRRPSRCAA